MSSRPFAPWRWIVSIAAACVVVLASPPAVRAQTMPRLLPIDQAATRSDFLDFRNYLQDIIRHKDVGALLRIVHPNIKNSFGGDDGIDGFKQHWRPESPGTEIWRELGEVLALGGAFDDAGNFTAPYVFARWPERFDSFEHVAVIGSGVRVRAAPGTSSRVIARISYAILEIDPQPRDTEGWQAVLLPGGTKGYVSTTLVRSPIDYRAYFTRENGQWLMTMFLAGD